MTPDPFDTAALRSAVLTAWRASPARLREDANVEEDHARGHYRDRVVVELAQNAADAAVRAGVAGRLLLRLARTDDGTTLVAASTGEPLDAAGVAALASMRASAKRGGAPGIVGRYGVGFAAVRAVSDEVSVLSSSGGVRFSLRDTADTLADLAARDDALAQEVVRRDGSLPALRLPFAAEGRPPEGFDTAVVLVLRDEVAADEVRTLLAAVDDALLLALPALTEVLVEDETSPGGVRRLAHVHERWWVATDEGELPRDLLADRPVEERDATRWRVTWALPRSSGDALDAARPSVPRVVHAPTPTDEPLDLPALLVATLPLDATRRHVATGRLTDELLRRAASTYARLAELVAGEREAGLGPAAGDALALVPTSLPAGPLDAALRPLLLDALASARLLARADDREPVPARHAVALVGAGSAHALAALGRRVPALVVVPPGRDTQARLLGVEVRSLADVVEALPADDDWRDLYDTLDELATHDPAGREALANLPVPLADGRVVRGARGAVLVSGPLADDVVDTLVGWGVRVVDERAAHPLLERLGAQAPDALGLLRLPAVRAAVLTWDDEHDEHDEHDDRDVPDSGAARVDVTTAVLTLVAACLPARDPARWSATTGAADALPDDVREWLALLPVGAATGERAPADGLVLPGSFAHRVLDERVLTAVATDEVERWGAATLVAAGVREVLVTVTVPDVVTDEEPSDDAAGALSAQALDGWPEYVEHLADVLGPGVLVGDVVAVADLDAVAVDAWPDVLEAVAGDAVLRSAVLGPVRGEVVGGGDRAASSYTAWWLRERAPLGLGEPFVVPADAADDPAGDPAGDPAHDALVALLPPAPDAVRHLDAPLLRALGGVAHPAEVPPDAWADLLDAWPVGSQVDVHAAAAVWRYAQPDEPADRVPALVDGGRVLVVAAHDAAVAPSPMWWQRTDVAALVPAHDAAEALRLSHALDLPRVSELARGVVTRDDGRSVPLPAQVRALVPGAPAHWCEHEDLRVDHVAVEWWVDTVEDRVRVHATTIAGLAAALAQACGRWSLRHALEAVLLDPARAPELLLDAALDALP